MRSPALSVLLGLLFALPLGGSLPGSQSLPGLHRVESRINALDPPYYSPRKTVNPARLEEEATELARLSAGIPEQIQSVKQRLLSKDLDSQLKRIEKLAKHLRSELRQ
jgi:hypothetical protein